MPEENAVSVLVVDDDPNILALLQAVLTNWGYRVVCAADGEEAWKHLDTEPPDLVLLDFEMPGIDGGEVCRLMKRHRRKCSIPVLLMSGRPDVDALSRRAGADGFLCKPFGLDELHQELDTAIRQRLVPA